MTRPLTRIRTLAEPDFDDIITLSRRVYPESAPWRRDQLASHLGHFPEGQFVAIDVPTGKVIGLASSLIVHWDDYAMNDDWRTFTDRGMFTNHDPEHGRTLYVAEVMVDPDMRRRGIGGKLYAARRALVTRLGLRRIRGAGRLRGYHKVAKRMSAHDYVAKIVRGEVRDPTLTFQLNHGFEIVAVVSNYLAHDPESLGWAAVFEWLNPEVASDADRTARDPRFIRPEAPTVPSRRPKGRD